MEPKVAKHGWIETERLRLQIPIKFMWAAFQRLQINSNHDADPVHWAKLKAGLCKTDLVNSRSLEQANHARYSCSQEPTSTRVAATSIQLGLNPHPLIRFPNQVQKARELCKMSLCGLQLRYCLTPKNQNHLLDVTGHYGYHKTPVKGTHRRAYAQRFCHTILSHGPDSPVPFSVAAPVMRSFLTTPRWSRLRYLPGYTRSVYQVTSADLRAPVRA